MDKNIEDRLMLLFKDAADSEDFREFKDAVLNWMEAVTRRIGAHQKMLAEAPDSTDNVQRPTIYNE